MPVGARRPITHRRATKTTNTEEREDWTRLSQQALEHAYAADEPDYSLDAIKEPNPGTIAQWTYRQ